MLTVGDRFPCIVVCLESAGVWGHRAQGWCGGCAQDKTMPVFRSETGISPARAPVHRHRNETEMGQAELLTAMRDTRRCHARRARSLLV